MYDMDQVMDWAWEQEIEAAQVGAEIDDDWADDPRNEWPDFPPED